MVTDPSGASIPKAQVTLTNTATGLERQTVSNGTGEYELLQVTPGAYRLAVEAPGFKKYEASNLQLQVNSPATVNVALEVGATSETVAVTAETPLLNTVGASIGAVMTENQVKELPIEGRDVASLYSLQPGVVYLGNNPNIDQNTDTRSGAVNGARSDQSNILLDGVDANDQTRGYAFTSVLRMTLTQSRSFEWRRRTMTPNQGALRERKSALSPKAGLMTFTAPSTSTIATPRPRRTITSSNYRNSSTITSPAAVLGFDTAPRLTSLNVVPPSVLAAAPPGGFPQTPPDIPGNIVWGVDNALKTPYAYQLDFSVSRELPKNMIFEASYVGHLGHRLLTQEDLAMPLDLVDTATGIDYFKAATRFAQLGAAGVPTSAITPALVGPTAAYWGHIFPNLPALSGLTGMTPLQAAYSIMDDPSTGYLHNETTGLYVLDYPGVECPNGCSKFGPNAFYNKQYASLYGWRTIGNSSYHGLQVSLRKRFSQGVQFDFNYTFSKSIDLSSDAERIGPYGGLGGQVINSWDYKALRAVSDFDTTHQITANWVGELPFGRNRKFGGNVNGLVDAIIGGWELTGIWRWTSGFPFSVSNRSTWPTNWQLSGNAIPIAPLPTTGAYKNGNGTVNVFADGTAAVSDFRHDYPGESGVRNNLRGDGIFNIDMGLDKRWKMPIKNPIAFSSGGRSST